MSVQDTTNCPRTPIVFASSLASPLAAAGGCEILSMPRPSRRSLNANADGRSVDRGGLHAARRLPLADKCRGISGRSAIGRDQHFVFTAADGAIARRKAARSNDAYRWTRRTLLTPQPGRTRGSFGSGRTWLPGIALWTGGTRRSGIAFGTLSATGQAGCQRQHDKQGP
jgi:hypothetical protein